MGVHPLTPQCVALAPELLKDFGMRPDAKHELPPIRKIEEFKPARVTTHLVDLDEQGRFTLSLKYDHQCTELTVSLWESRQSGEKIPANFSRWLSSALCHHLTISVPSGEYKLEADFQEDPTAPATVTLKIPDDEKLATMGMISIGGWSIAELIVNPREGDITFSSLRQLRAFDLRGIRSQGSSYFENLTNKNPHAPAISFSPRCDLHTHFAGQVDDTDLLNIGVANNTGFPVALLERLEVNIPPSVCRYISGGEWKVGLRDLVHNLIAAAPEEYEKFRRGFRIDADRVATFNDLEEIYDCRSVIAKDPKNFKPILTAIAKQYRSHGVEYAELSLRQIADPDWLAMAHDILPTLEKETGVTLRFLAAIRRDAPLDAQYDAVERAATLAAYSPYIVGVDFLGQERNSTLEFRGAISFAAGFREIIPYFQVRVHAGESPEFPENIRVAIESGATRIGHGIYGCDEEVLKLAQEAGVTVEFNINSNRALNFIDAHTSLELGEELHIPQYLDAGIAVTLGTDGAGIYCGGGDAETYVAHLAGVTQEQFDTIAASDKRYIESMRVAQECFWNDNDIAEDPRTLKLPRPRASIESPAERELKLRLKYRGLSKTLKEHHVEELALDGVSALLETRIPVFFSGAANSWAKVKSHEDVCKTISDFLSLIDPEKTVLITGGFPTGIYSVLHFHAKRLGIPCLAIIPGQETDPRSLDISLSNPNERSGITHAHILNSTWTSRTSQILKLIKPHNGMSVFLGGGQLAKDEILASVYLDVPALLMTGQGGASESKARTFPERTFSNGYELLIEAMRLRPEIALK